MEQRPRTKEQGGQQTPKRTRTVLVVSSLSVIASTALFFIVPALNPTIYDPHAPQGEKDTGVLSVEPGPTSTLEADTRAPARGPIPAYVPVPDAVKAIYMSQCVVGTPNFRADLVKIVDETELNAIIIDIKDYTGKISFTTDNPILAPSVSDECGARDMRAFVQTLHENGIYVIGRITVFQDPFYSKNHPELAVKFANPVGSVWKDHKGLSFIDVGAKPFWDFIIELSRETHALGFDEINYDYIRFPSDGPMANIHFDWAGDKEKALALEEFFAYLSKEMRDVSKYPQGVEPPKLSADLFGMVTTNYDDLNIGQVLERALPYFDYIAPMVYPSHYPKGFNNWNNPNTVPYELIKFVMDSAVRRTVASESPVQSLLSEPVYKTITVPAGTSTATTTKKVPSGTFSKQVYDKDKIRPWLQDFDYGGTYDVAEVRAQIKATYDAGLDSWMLWAPSNRYTQGALEP
jgi:hypothetical protein